MNNLLNQARAAAAQGAAENMTETTKGGGARVLPEGTALARFTSYIEKGSHVQTFNGEAKAPAPQFQLGFTIVGGRGINAKGEPENMVQGDVFPSVNSYDISLSRNVKSNSIKIFNSMNYKRDVTTFPELLGRLFLLKISHAERDGKKVHRVDWKSIQAPIDPMTATPYEAPEAPDDAYRLFLWNHPTKEQWDSLFIEGSRDDGTSKNFIQEDLMKAVDFLGSPLEALLAGAELPALTTEAAPEAPAKAPKKRSAVPEA